MEVGALSGKRVALCSSILEHPKCMFVKLLVSVVLVAIHYAVNENFTDVYSISKASRTQISHGLLFQRKTE